MNLRLRILKKRSKEMILTAMVMSQSQKKQKMRIKTKKLTEKKINKKPLQTLTLWTVKTRFP